MEKKVAAFICAQVDDCMMNNQTSYDIVKMNIVNGTINGFHQWTNGKPIIAGYHFSKPEESGYYLLFIDWHRNNRYYLVIYPQNKSTTLAEMQNIIEQDDGKEVITWKYNPLKRDGKNQERKAYFKQLFGSTHIHIPIPTSRYEVETFFDQLISLCQKRIKADRIVDVFKE
ncbi:hypothetical protein AN964_24035 [Heyndrickxia shackletonii]|uniref:Uncharacterized protein n=1 Tax=Heyndrickxia shackletonii TaxID=157838 RepID=A0A0Q3WPK7_9BACI|nr:hypothetical protein [Heyndrickxia shackletonii]KQL50701.1 hypothetical protein AN964_24035 [Heyndrickxia shackletonii]NEY97962.1 hypothetical protein [Heyndrickxia shackletonii]